MEGPMNRRFYKVERHEDKWVVLACSNKLLICKTKKIALELTRRATYMMRNIDLPTHQECLNPDRDLRRLLTKPQVKGIAASRIVDCLALIAGINHYSDKCGSAW
jgi:hypothetical protein